MLATVVCTERRGPGPDPGGSRAALAVYARAPRTRSVATTISSPEARRACEHHVRVLSGTKISVTRSAARASTTFAFCPDHDLVTVRAACEHHVRVLSDCDLVTASAPGSGQGPRARSNSTAGINRDESTVEPHRCRMLATVVCPERRGPGPDPGGSARFACGFTRAACSRSVPDAPCIRRAYRF